MRRPGSAAQRDGRSSRRRRDGRSPHRDPMRRPASRSGSTASFPARRRQNRKHPSQTLRLRRPRGPMSRRPREPRPQSEARRMRSELPDLSTAVPRPLRNRPAPERPGGEPVSSARTNRMQVRATHRRSGACQHADPPRRPVERAQGVAGAVRGAVLRLDDRGRVPVPGSGRHGCVGEAQQQCRGPAEQHVATANWCPAARSSAVRR